MDKTKTCNWLHWGQFRHAVIGELLSGPPDKGDLQQALARLSERVYQHPIDGNQKITFGLSTIERWYYKARNADDPVAVLGRKIRSDAGVRWSMSNEIFNALKSQYKTYSRWTVQLHYDNLKVTAKEHPEWGKMPGYKTVLRCMRNNGWSRSHEPAQPTLGQKRSSERRGFFTMEKILWKLDQFFNGGYQMAVLDMAAGKRWRVKALSSNLTYLKGENARNNHILIQPLEQAFYLMADDITPEFLRRHHKLPSGTWKPGRMVVETSPENFQVWIHSHRPISLEEKRYWLKKMKSDPGADPCNRWGRCPGFRNRKSKYRNSHGFYPLARLIWADYKHTANIPPSVFIKEPYESEHLSHLPLEGGVCHLPVFPRSHYDRGDESATDFAFSMALFRRGMDENEVKRKLLEQRTAWENHSNQKQNDAYLRRTISKAKRFVETS